MWFHCAARRRRRRKRGWGRTERGERRRREEGAREQIESRVFFHAFVLSVPHDDVVQWMFE